MSFKFYILLLIIFTNTISAQVDESKVVVRIGDELITENEFIERFELTPQLSAGIIGGEESIKREVLYSIIAEKLWALEADAMGLNNSELMTSAYKAIEKMYVRDALYKKEILNKVNLSDGYLNEAFRRNSLLLNTNYIFSEREQEINDIYEQLNNGIDFYSIFLKRSESSLQEKPYVVSYGQMQKDVEDILYNLKPGEFAKPVKAPNGWYIFRLISIEPRTIENSQQADEQRKYVVKVARSTYTDSIHKDFYSRFFKNAVAETNKEMFLKLSNLVILVLQNRGQKEKLKYGDKIYLQPDDLYKIENELGSELLNAQFIKLNDYSTTINDFLQELSIDKFYVDSLDNNHIKGRLNFAVKKFVEHELLAREGFKQGLQNTPEVQRYLKMWRSYYLSEALRNELADSIQITDADAYEHFHEKNNVSSAEIEVKIIELLTENLDIIRTVLDELNSGKDFRELAVTYTIREEAKKNNGEIGYFPVNTYGEIGQKAATMKIGDIYGPIKVPEGYSLFELVDRKTKDSLSKANYESVKERIKAELKQIKYNDALMKKTVELAKKYDVQISEETLNSINVLNTTTVVYRYFGFGGRLLAVPMTTPNYLWVKPWQNQKELTP